MALSFTQSTGDGANKNFSVGFQYLAQSHVTVLVDGTPVAFTWMNPSMVTTAVAPINGAVVQVQRVTPRDVILVDFVDGSTLTESDLDTATLQTFFLAQEGFDVATSSLGLLADGSFSAFNRRISTLAAPTGPTDAVTKGYHDGTFIPEMQALLGQTITAKDTTLGFRDTTLTARDVTLGHRNAAAVSETNSATTATNSANSATASQTSRVGAETAQTGAQTARTGAETARDVTTTARDATTTARDVTLGYRDVTLGYRNETEAFKNSAAASAAAANTFNPANYVGKSEHMGSFRNRLINGDFRIWQRGTSGGTGYLADRFTVNLFNAAVSQQRVAFTAGQTQVPGEPAFHHRTNCDSNASTSNSFIAFIQAIEDVRSSAGKQVTLSFWAKANAPKNIALETRQNFGTGGSATVLTYIGQFSLTTNWQKFTVTFNLASIAGKTVAVTSLLNLVWWYSAGSDFNARTGGLGTQVGSFDMTQVQLEEGPVATPFEQRPIGLELMLCQRYFEKSYADGEAPGSSQITSAVNGRMMSTNNDSTATTWGALNFRVPKRAVPTVTIYNPDTGVSGQVRDNSTPANVTAIASAISQERFRVNFGANIPDVYVVAMQWTADAEL